MSQPVTYTGSITIDGTVDRCLPFFDPQHWSRNVPEIWLDSYLIGPSPAPAGALPLTSRAETPPKDQPLSSWNWRLFFEHVRVVGLEYRNVLETRFWLTPPAGPPLTRFDFEYRQYDCLTTESATGIDDGGIDVDYGFSKCWYEANGDVCIEISKTVRYKQPSYLYGELNGLSLVMLPLVFDGWLHQLLFGDA